MWAHLACHPWLSRPLLLILPLDLVSLNPLLVAYSKSPHAALCPFPSVFICFWPILPSLQAETSLAVSTSPLSHIYSAVWLAARPPWAGRWASMLESLKLTRVDKNSPNTWPSAFLVLWELIQGSPSFHPPGSPWKTRTGGLSALGCRVPVIHPTSLGLSLPLLWLSQSQFSCETDRPIYLPYFSRLLQKFLGWPHSKTEGMWRCPCADTPGPSSTEPLRQYLKAREKGTD